MRPRLELEPSDDTSTDVNLDESLVPDHELPPIGATTPDAWPARRGELLERFEDHVYGRTPSFDAARRVAEMETGPAFGGRAVRRQTTVTVANELGTVELAVLAYTPADTTDPVAAFLVPNFDGNHTIADDPAIIESARARRDRGEDVAERGTKAHRFPVETIVGRGYGLVTFYAADADADHDDGFAHGVQRLAYATGQTRPAADEWGTIGAWAWACREVLDLVSAVDCGIDPDRVVVGGHSRLGKTALWAAANDERFAGAFSNDSGCTGAALSRRAFGETVAVINALFPHWFCRNYRHYGNNESALPVDQHQLIALLAPRPVHIASATDDAWADPRGEFLATAAAGEAWEVHGLPGLALTEFPEPDTGAVGPVAYHLRTGGHDLLAADWAHLLDWADAQVGSA